VFPSVETNWRVATNKYNAADANADSDKFLTSDGLQAKFVRALYDRLVLSKDDKGKLDYTTSNPSGALKELEAVKGPWDGGRPSTKEENLVT
jgi:hypothetical protein